MLAVRRALDAVSPSLGVVWYRRGHAFLLRRSLRRVLAETGDAVVYAQCPISAEVALAVRPPAGVRVVMAAHFNLSQADEWVDKGRIRRGGRVFRGILDLEASVIPRLDGIVHVSADVRRHVESRIDGARGIPSTVVPNFVDEASMPSSASDNIGGAGATGDLVSVGSLEPRKNQAYLLEILDEMARLGARPSLDLLGDGQDRERLANRARELGLASQVRFLGIQPNAAQRLSGYRVYCHAARMESFGMAILEAMAAGLPVMAAPVGGIPEVFRDGIEGRYWPLDDAPAAARILTETMADDLAVARMGRAARERAATTFAARICGPALVAFLQGRPA